MHVLVGEMVEPKPIGAHLVSWKGWVLLDDLKKQAAMPMTTFYISETQLKEMLRVFETFETNYNLEDNHVYAILRREKNEPVSPLMVDWRIALSENEALNETEIVDSWEIVSVFSKTPLEQWLTKQPKQS